MLLKEREDLIVRAVTRGHRRGVKALSTLFSLLRLKFLSYYVCFLVWCSLSFFSGDLLRCLLEIDSYLC